MTSITSPMSSVTANAFETPKILFFSRRNATAVSNLSHQAFLQNASSDNEDSTKEPNVLDEILASIQDPSLFCFYHPKYSVLGVCKCAPCLIVEDHSYKPKNHSTSSRKNTLILLLSNETFKVVGDSSLFSYHQGDDTTVMDSPLLDIYLEANLDQGDRAQERRKLESILDRILANKNSKTPSKSDTKRTMFTTPRPKQSVAKKITPHTASSQKAVKQSSQSKRRPLVIGVNDIVEYKMPPKTKGLAYAIHRSRVAHLGKSDVLLEDGHSLNLYSRVRVKARIKAQWQDMNFRNLNKYRFRDDRPEMHMPQLRDEVLDSALKGLLSLQNSTEEL